MSAPPREYRTLLVPYDFSSHAEAALATALDLAKRFGAELHLLHVIQSPAYATAGYDGVPLDVPQDIQRGVRESLARIASASGESVRAHVVDGASIAERIADCATQLGVDLIVMGTQGRSGLAHALLGSVAERTLRSAPCPVLTVRDRAREAA
ncbi:MAG TPA: universal stress protein [Myxococcota bacterium]|nr:universal stress protein [Myxococcota bacterium]